VLQWGCQKVLGGEHPPVGGVDNSLARSQRSRLHRRCASHTRASVQPRPQPMSAHMDFGHCSHAATCSPTSV